MRTVVYGSRPDGHARVVVERFGGVGGLELVGLLDDHPENAGRRIGELAVVGGSADLGRLAAEGVEAVVLGFGAARGRRAVLEAIAAAGLALPVLVHPSAVVAASATLAPGCQVMPLAVVGSGVALGRGTLVGTGAIVEHDAQLDEAVVVSPAAVLTGRVTVGAAVEIGSGAAVLPDVWIGAAATVGAGAVVTRDVPAGVTVVGVPARQLGASAHAD